MKDKHGKVIYEPYRIKVLNTINFKKSMHYNPFAYIHSEKDILKLVTTLIANTKGEGKAGDDFWVKAETLLYQTNNFYAVLKRQEMLDKEVYDIVHRNKKMAASDVRENRGKNCAAGKDKEKAVPRR